MHSHYVGKSEGYVDSYLHHGGALLAISHAVDSKQQFAWYKPSHALAGIDCRLYLLKHAHHSIPPNSLLDGPRSYIPTSAGIMFHHITLTVIRSFYY